MFHESSNQCVAILLMNLLPDELPDRGFKLLAQLHHQELVPFVQEYLKVRTFYSVLYWLCNLVTFAITGYLFLQKAPVESYGLGARFESFAIGLAISFGLLPIHEYIHVLAYRWMGAKDTSYAMNLKNFYFLAIANRFVANRAEFTIIALAPIAAISLFLVLIGAIVPPTWQLTIAGAALAHTAMCSGDFGCSASSLCTGIKKWSRSTM